MKELGLHEIKQIQLEILKNIDSFCKENEIKYSLYFGTLLGAVRHKGFIPWDDDIDLIMPRPDYDKFINLYNHGKYRVLSTNLDSKYPYLYAKVDDTNTKFIENTDIEYDMGVHVDVFPLEGIPEDDNELIFYFKKINRYRNLLHVKTIKITSTRSLIKNLILKTLKILTFWISYEKIILKFQNEVDKFNYKDSKYLLAPGFHKDKKRKLSKFFYQELIELDFEGVKFKALKEYDKFLTMQYGNYMQLPNEKDRLTHHAYKAYFKENYS